MQGPEPGYAPSVAAVFRLVNLVLAAHPVVKGSLSYPHGGSGLCRYRAHWRARVGVEAAERGPGTQQTNNRILQLGAAIE